MRFGFFILLAALLVGAGSVSAQDEVTYRDLPAGVYELDKAHASLIWKVSHLGLSDYMARFTSFDASYDFDPEKPEQSSVRVSVDPTSVETDYPYEEEKDFDAKLVEGADWFNSSVFPEITFESTGLEMTGENTGVLRGDLTFLGVTAPVSLDVTLNGVKLEHPFAERPVMGFSARGVLKRSEWGMTHAIPGIGDAVELLIEAEFIKRDNEL